MKALIISVLHVLTCNVQAQVGLKGSYYQGTNFEKKVFDRTDPQIDFHWAQNVKLKKDFEASCFSIRWAGQIYSPFTTVYYFSAKTNDELQIWVDNQLILDKFSKANYYKFGTGITLVGKRWYSIKIEYRNEGYISDKRSRDLVLYWETLQDRQGPIGESGAFRKIIPAHYLSPLSPSVQLVTEINDITLRRTERSPKMRRNTVKITNRSSINIDRVEQTVTKPTIKLEKGKGFVLEQVQFEQGSHILRKESLPLLNELVYILMSSPSLHIEVSGHTDNVGDSQLNLTLSEYRARQVANYLVKQGVNVGQLFIKGYGSQRSIGDNRTEVERAKNRRVEIKVL